MKLAAAFLIAAFIHADIARAQRRSELHENPLAADLPMVVPNLATSSIQTTSAASRLSEANPLSGGSRYTLTINRRSSTRRPAQAGMYLGAGQAQFFYFPHYAGRSRIGVTNRRKPALAPMPIIYSPLSDPFYEEKELHRLLGDETPFYP
jgi:hypothetical protein